MFFNLHFQLLIPQKFVTGFHIQIKDLSSKPVSSGSKTGSGTFDVITISGGGTRSHTLTDLRPDTRYAIFVLPYHKRIKGVPSNLKMVTTKEDGKDIENCCFIHSFHSILRRHGTMFPLNLTKYHDAFVPF